MNRKQKIIISVTGIFIVLLILVGLTYAYFLTRIQGNTNSKSISVTTADLKLTYGDGTNQILSSDTKLIPSNDAIGVKDFTVTNEGDDTSYVVVIEDVKILKASDGTTTTFNSNDFRYTLTCTKSDGSSCDGVSTQTVLPLTKGVLVGNSITAGDVHTYKLTVWYIETNTDQSEDMGKTLEAKVNITNMESVNPYSSNTNSLAYNIIENARTKANGTELLASPKTKVAEKTSSFIYVKGSEPTSFTSTLSNATNYYISYADDYKVDETTGKFTLVNSKVATAKYTTSMANDLVGKYVVWGTSVPTEANTQNQNNIYKISTNVSDITSTIKYATISSSTKSTEKELSTTIDDYGTSYYYRGGVEDNYVDFAGMCWRIVRIAGDGSIKLILEDQDSTCATSDGNWNIPTETSVTTKTGNFGYTQYDENALTASNGTQNANSLTIMNYLNGGTSNATSMATAFKNFQTGPLANYLDKLKSGDWCLNDKAYLSETDNTTSLSESATLDNKIAEEILYYDASIRLNGKTTKEPTLKCTGINMSEFADENNSNMYIGTLTADEMVFAGAISTKNTANDTHYLINNYQKSNSLSFWSLTPNYYDGETDRVYSISKYGVIADNDVKSYLSFRPSINLKNNIEIQSGNGTKKNAYKLS